MPIRRQIFAVPILCPKVGFKNFAVASTLLAGIEMMHMIRKGRMIVMEGAKLSFAVQSYARAG